VFLFPGLDIFRIIAKIFPKAHGELKLMMEINEYNDIWDVYITNRSQKKNCMQFNHYLSKTIFPQLDICLVMTESLLKYYSQFPNINPKIAFLKLPMTVDLYRFEDVPNKFNLEKPYIAYCGSSSFYKDGVDILIKSFAEVSSEYFDLKLYIAAFWEKDGPKMMRLIHDTGLEDKIIYLGIVNRDEIPPLIMNAKILALPRPDSRQAQGGFPTKLGEYLASGNPVCITRIGEITDYLVDNESAFIAEPGDIESFINALKRVLSDEVNAKRVGKNGRKVAEMHFNMDVQAGRLYNFLIETLH
jgi:glycosyltransferase involved in cell wall biosynthesis